MSKKRILVKVLLSHLRNNPHGVAVNGRVYNVDPESGMLYLPGEKYGVAAADAAELRAFPRAYQVYAPKAPPPPARRASASGGTLASSAPDLSGEGQGVPSDALPTPSEAPVEGGGVSEDEEPGDLRYELEGLSKTALKVRAREVKIAGYSVMDRDELIEALLG